MRTEDRKHFPPIEVTLGNGVTVSVRPLYETDAEALADFYAAVPREDLRFYLPHPLTREKALENAARADSPLEVVLVLEAPGAVIVGYAWYRWHTEDAPQSHFGICVRRGFQEAGAGTALVKRLLEIAKTVGPPVMALTVQEANKRAVKLYTAMGFRIVREQTRQANPDLGFEAEPEYAMEAKVR